MDFTGELYTLAGARKENGREKGGKCQVRAPESVGCSRVPLESPVESKEEEEEWLRPPQSPGLGAPSSWPAVNMDGGPVPGIPKSATLT